MEKRKVIGIVADVFLGLSIFMVLLYRAKLLKTVGWGFWPGVVVGCVFLVLIYVRVLMKD